MHHRWLCSRTKVVNDRRNDRRNSNSIVQGLSAVLEAAAFPSNVLKKLVVFVQSQKKGKMTLASGAPAAAEYKAHSSNTRDVWEGMKEKAESQLAELCKAETNAGHNFVMLTRPLEDRMAVDTKDMPAMTATRVTVDGPSRLRPPCSVSSRA